MAIDSKFYDLPQDGNIYVDGSGIQYSSSVSGFDVESHKETIDFLTEFNKRVKVRNGGILTVDSVLEEITHSLEYYKNMFEGIKKVRKRKVAIYGKGKFLRSEEKHFVDRAYMDSVFHVSKKAAKEYRKFCNSLEEGMVLYGLAGDVELSREKEFVDDFNLNRLPSNEKLSLPDKDLVVAALGSGDGNSIFSADRRMVETYYIGVKKFGLRGCFVCDSRQGRSYPV